MNQGLVIISPILLVRLLTVEEFGRYREFLLYAGLLTTICAFGINNSLLYFIPSRPNSVRQMVRQAIDHDLRHQCAGGGRHACSRTLSRMAPFSAACNCRWRSMCCCS